MFKSTDHVNICTFHPDDATAVTDIFYDTIHAIADKYYTPAQRKAWAPLPKDYAFWAQRLNNKPPYVAMIDDQIVGFMSLEENGYIDWAFTHKDYQRCGVASRLYAYLENEAATRGIEKLFVEASFLAKPFFIKKGFTVIMENNIQRRGQILVNWSMEKYLHNSIIKR